LNHSTEQEEFWASEFGHDYITRNQGDLVEKRLVPFWARILSHITQVNTILELGCNIGLNLKALNSISPTFELTGYEINKQAANECAATNIAHVENKSILEPISLENRFDLTFTKGVLIHINPDFLYKVYENLVKCSRKYILVCEYYSPKPVMINYRGHTDRLFKRDFAGELMDQYQLQLVDYGFVYHRDQYFPADDVNWFLLEKPSLR